MTLSFETKRSSNSDEMYNNSRENLTETRCNVARSEWSSVVLPPSHTEHRAYRETPEIADGLVKFGDRAFCDSDIRGAQLEQSARRGTSRRFDRLSAYSRSGNRTDLSRLVRGVSPWRSCTAIQRSFRAITRNDTNGIPGANVYSGILYSETLH